MASMSDYWENATLDTIIRGQSVAIGSAKLCWCAAATTVTPPTFYIALYTATPGDATSGTEVTGGSYTRQPIVGNMTNWAGSQAAGSTTASSGTSGTTSNNIAISFANMPAASLTGFAICDAVSGGNVLYWGGLTGAPIAVAAGATVTFNSGSLTLQVDN